MAAFGTLATSWTEACPSREREAAPGGPAPVSYAAPDVLARLPFGTRSHWLQPWREAIATLPAETLADAIGAVIEDVTQPTAATAVSTLARAGLRHLRFEIGWGDLDYATESRFGAEASIRHLLLACRHAKVRPLILLNAHHAKPAPHEAAEVRLAAEVRAGDRVLMVATNAPILLRLTGITDPIHQVMAGLVVERAEEGRLYLSRPFPVSLPAGALLQLATLRYEPFSEPGSARNEATLAGWLRYVDAVAELAGSVMQTGSGTDRGFDLEIWNELTFGSQFLSLGNYYDTKPEEARALAEATWAELPARTAAHVAACPARYAGVALVNGFASTVPWTASSRQHPRIGAITKHPYPPERVFPRDAQRNIQALGPDARPTDFEPAYTAFFPEYQATAIQTETLMRDVSATPNPIYGVMHGRLARQREGRPDPVEVWLTEIGVNPAEFGVIERAAADRLKTKYCLRAALFHAGIGVARTYLFNAVGSRAEFALVEAGLPGSATPPLRALGQALELLCGPSQPRRDVPPRRLSFAVHPSEPGARPIFGGDGAGQPPLTGADCLVLLPVQQASGCLAIAYYIMTRDVRVEWPAERLRIEVEGLGRIGAACAHDPVSGLSLAAAVSCLDEDRILLEVDATDSPRILLLGYDATPRRRA